MISQTMSNDNHANQCNPNNEAYWSSRGEEYDNPDTRTNELRYESDEYESDEGTKTQADWDNYSNQLNPNNDAYWSSRK